MMRVVPKCSLYSFQEELKLEYIGEWVLEAILDVIELYCGKV